MTAPLRTFELHRAHILQLKSIDDIAQEFTAHLMIEFIVRDGALDEEFSKNSDEWPQDGWPAALWYLSKQFEYVNSKGHTVLESKVFKDGDDLVLVQRVEGAFSEEFERTSRRSTPFAA